MDGGRGGQGNTNACPYPPLPKDSRTPVTRGPPDRPTTFFYEGNGCPLSPRAPTRQEYVKKVFIKKKTCAPGIEPKG